MLTMRVLRTLKGSMMTAGNSGVGVYNVIPDPRNGSVGTCGVSVDGRNGFVGVCCEFLLEAESWR